MKMVVLHLYLLLSVMLDIIIILKYLLKLVANINKNFVVGFIPLYYACLKKHHKIYSRT